MDAVKETEKLLRMKLEATGQLAKMRAMVAEASLKVLDDSDDASLFHHSKELLAAKRDNQGLQSLGTVLDFLEHLGLGYTASVLKMEAGLQSTKLPSKEELSKTFGIASSDVLLLQLMKRTSGASSAPVAAVAPAVTQPTPTPTPTPAVTAPVAAAAKVVKSKSIETKYEIAEWEDREFTRFQEVAGQQVQLWNLKRCKVFVFDPLDSMTVDDVVDSELVVAACEGSVFLRNCSNMTVYVACKQLRLRDCENLDIRLFATTDPVVEKSHHISFKPFNIRTPAMIAGFKAARLDAAVNRFVHVYDFTVDDPDLPKPHFTVHYPNHGLTMKNFGESVGKPECPQEIEELLAGRLQPAHSSEAGPSKSLNIKTGAASWKQEQAPAAEAPQPVVKAAAAVPAPVPAAVAPAAAAAEDTYSSYSDSSDDASNYAVDEDEDDF